MTVGGSHAGPEMMLLAITSGARFVEVPVNYLPRVGISSVTGKPLAALGVGLRMILLILRFRVGRRGDCARPRGARPRRGGQASEEAHDRVPLRPDRRGLRRVASRRTWSSTTSTSGPRSCSSIARRPGARRRLRHRGAGDRLGRPGYEVTGVDPSEGMLDVLRGADAEGSGGERDPGTSLPFPRRQLRPRPQRRRHAPHRRAADVRRTLAEMVRVTRPGGRHPGLGPQPAQPVLAAADGARAAGHRRGEAHRRWRELVEGLRAMPAPSPCS